MTPTKYYLYDLRTNSKISFLFCDYDSTCAQGHSEDILGWGEFIKMPSKNFRKCQLEIFENADCEFMEKLK